MGKGEPTPKEIKALSEADRMELMWWQVGRGGTGLWNGLNWTSSLRDTIELLTKTPSQQVVAVFWLRLYGVLREVRAAYTPTLILEDTEEGDLESDSEYDAYHDAETDYFDELAAQVRKQCDRLVAVFSEDELLFIQWKRDAEAHVWLVGYEMGIKRVRIFCDGREPRDSGGLDRACPAANASRRQLAIVESAATSKRGLHRRSVPRRKWRWWALRAAASNVLEEP